MASGLMVRIVKLGVSSAMLERMAPELCASKVMACYHRLCSPFPGRQIDIFRGVVPFMNRCKTP